jgi:acetyl-CoA carboxylase biotin carboxylase subunit
MFQKVLIANRGEIAVRVISACKDLGIRTVAVYSEADRSSLHVRYADEALCIGPPRSADSYLNIPAVISAAEITDVDAIHPGYGFLAEDPGFAEVCDVSGIKFIGPRSDVIRLMGDKAQARRAAKKAGIPIVPGTEDPVKSVQDAHRWANEIGYPIIVKAAAGGGGRGMRIVRSAEKLEELFHQAQHEAAISFHSSEVYIEKFIDRPRHIEFQVLGDEQGKCVAIAERECSIQRRHQKLLEEGPSPSLDAETRKRMCDLVGKALSEIGYSNAGTVEFLMDEQGDLYFIELNARIQVEHPVTEAITGIDLVRSQILLAAGEPLDAVLPEKIEIRGHAIECRINAENPQTFVPSAGKISQLITPGGIGVRVDTAAYSGWFVPPYYDSLVAKLIVHGKDRDEAIARTRRALDCFSVEGIHTSISLHQRILADPEFLAGRYDTHFIERMNSKRAAG